MTDHHKRQIERTREDALELTRDVNRRGGSALPTFISALALLFSGFSFYETVMRAPELAVYVPPQIQYTDPDRPDSPFEVFVVPLTLANHGARSGTVLSIDLEVTNPRTGKTKRFYAANVGPWGQQSRQAFSPVALAGRAATSQTIQFFPRVDETLPRILDFEAGDYRLKLTLATSEAETISLLKDIDLFKGKAEPLEFNMRIGKLDYRNFNGPGTMAMWSPDYKPASNAGQ
ncbi:MAG: hypothetical protein AAGC70_11135 [Pseudomonadota bacterium]